MPHEPNDHDESNGSPEVEIAVIFSEVDDQADVAAHQHTTLDLTDVQPGDDDEGSIADPESIDGVAD